MIRARFAYLAVAGCALCGPAAATHAQPAPAAKPLVFDVVSVREDDAANGARQLPEIGPTADGYRSMHLDLLLPLLAAYVPTSGGAAFYSYAQVTGLPDWANRVSYNITAKVGEENLAEWQKPGSQPAMLRTMLQAMFSERFKLVVHREIKEQPVYLLVVAKGGPKLKETDPARTPPGMQTPFGGVAVQDRSGLKLYGISVGGIATFLSAMMGGERTVVDRTGLTGSYDLLLRSRESMRQDEDVQSVVGQELADYGLKLEPSKTPVETLVIDHVEKPTAN